MSSIYRKLLICPFFGELPPFYKQWEKSVKTLEKYGYDTYVTQDLDDFNARCESNLGFKSSIVPGTGKLWDYRCAFGELFADKIVGYDFWGTTDFDVVYGRVDRYVTDEVLFGTDLYSDEDYYVGGHWTLYRNTPKVNHLFRDCNWKYEMENPAPSGWVEFGYSDKVKEKLRYRFSKNQATRDNTGLSIEPDGTLLQHGKEVMLSHFKDQKRWPL